jgi:hypothetical protein
MLGTLDGAYFDRTGRARFIAHNFAGQLRGPVLDVGCGDALLRGFVPNYVGCDIAGKPDVRLDLDTGILPFGDGAFQTSVCTDVLEHVEPMRQVFWELFRVARQYVIISLPNLYVLGFRLRFLQGKVLSKEYSLEPRNRHRWLPSFAESSVTIRKWLPAGWTIALETGYYPPAWWRRGPAYTRYAYRYPNLFATTYWGLFVREDIAEG